MNGHPYGYGYGYYPHHPVLPPGLVFLPPNSNVHGTINIDDNRFWPYGWPNPTVPRPNPRPRPDPQPAPCPGHNMHCHGTCGQCGHVGCGGEDASDPSSNEAVRVFRSALTSNSDVAVHL
ncbi:hypothetical protein CONLIGDRAFT_635079 [Coniochaeta ligniaria NRRL 30616]|uniref:Uncharacterized protein n=1 Tax=Coniochaeta ligniaria NRRL 30616 TaxID=1408157 RepID=A0A1J7J0H5_9PEZI|nr:hypothetical protein CONLIGDRAFT_635079 [Coniochaeta ligniaria NRRL 30616]